MAGQPYTKAQQLGSQRKKYRRRVASRKTWEKLRDQRLGPCVICSYIGLAQLQPSELHHVVPRDRFGDDVPENLVPVCANHHAYIERGSDPIRRMLAAAVQHHEPAVYAYAIEKLGEDGWLRLYGVRFA